MRIEDSCGALLKQINDELGKRANNAMRPQDVTMTQFSVLMALRHSSEGEMPLKGLEQSLHVAQSTAVGIVARLEKKGFIVSLNDPDDKRIKRIRITDAGIECCRAAEKNMNQAEEELLAGLTETEREIFRMLLCKVRDSLI